MLAGPFQRYLGLLGVEVHPAGFDGLASLVRRHLWRVPFENVSKLLLHEREGAGRLLTLDEFLDGIEYADLGGTCYSSNGFFAELLRALGYDADLLGADMTKPNVHVSIRVRIDTVAYLVDVGFAAPFRRPIRLDRLPAELSEGGNRYVFDEDPAGVRLRMFSAAEYIVGYVAHDPPRGRDFFAPAVLNSFAPASLFMKSLRISRVFPHYSLDLIDCRLYRHEAGETVRAELRGLRELRTAVREQFDLPRLPVEAAVAVLERLTGRPFFPA